MLIDELIRNGRIAAEAIGEGRRLTAMAKPAAGRRGRSDAAKDPNRADNRTAEPKDGKRTRKDGGNDGSGRSEAAVTSEA